MKILCEAQYYYYSTYKRYNYLIPGENQAGVAEVVGAGGKYFVK